MLVRQVHAQTITLARVRAYLLELLREHGVMTTFSAVIAAVFVALLIFFQIRRTRMPGSAAGSPADTELLRQRYNNYAFAVSDEAPGMERTSEALREHASLRQSAGF